MKSPTRLVVFLLLVGLGLAPGYWYWIGPSLDSHRKDRLGPWGLGHELATRFPGSRVLIISNPFAAHPDTPQAIKVQEEDRIEGVKAGLGKGSPFVKVVYPELKPGAMEDPRSFVLEPGTPTPLSFLVTTNAFDRLYESHPDVDIIVSLIGIPLDLDQSATWKKPERPRFAFFLPDLRFLNGRPGVEAAFASGKLAAVVLNRPGTAAEVQQVRRLDEKTFSNHYLLMHEMNVSQIASQWGALFSK